MFTNPGFEAIPEAGIDAGASLAASALAPTYLHHHGSSVGKNLVVLRSLQINYNTRDWRLRAEQTHTKALYFPVTDLLVAQLEAGRRVGKIHYQAVGAGQHLGLRNEAITGFDFNLDRISVASTSTRRTEDVP